MGNIRLNELFLLRGYPQKRKFLRSLRILFYPVPFQLLPVQFHPVPRAVGGDGFAFFNLEGMAEVLFQAEAVTFQVGGVGHCAEGVDVEVVDAVRGDRSSREIRTWLAGVSRTAWSGFDLKIMKYLTTGLIMVPYKDRR